MYFVVILMESRKVLAIPASYVLKLDVVRKINSGLKNWKNQLIFFSPENHDPNFNLAIREDFDENVDGIYRANVLKAFDTKEQAESFVAIRRNVLPVNYFGQPAEQDSLDETIGAAFNIDVKRETHRIDSIADTLPYDTLHTSVFSFLACLFIDFCKII